MPNNLIQPQDQHRLSSNISFALPICRVLLGAIFVWFIIALIATLLVIWHTQNALTISLFPVFSSPALLFYRIFKALLSLLPMDEKRFQLEKTKVQVLPKIRFFDKRDKSKGYT